MDNLFFSVVFKAYGTKHVALKAEEILSTQITNKK